MMCKCGVVLSISVVIVSSLILLVTSFNVDTFNYVKHKGPEQSMFGFSVATHTEHGRSWVLVGAPTSQGQRSRIHRGGVVFKCNTTSDDGCEEIDFHQEKSGTSHPDDKNNQWFGATINSAGPDGPVVACAPRYVWFTTSREERRDPVGTCYIAKDDFNKVSEYSPCRTSFYGYHRQGSCQAGFSAGISKDGKRLFVGAPGSWYWQGQMYSIDPSVKFPYTPGMFGEAFGFGTKGQVIQQSLDDRPAVMSTPEGPARDDDSYMGYSMVVGDFNGAGVQGIAVGMPKGGEMLEGKVLLYTWNLTNYLNITGKQLGSYFGYALAASDVDGDGKDDVIIGAPMHAEPNNEMKYEVGRVHIAYQGKTSNYVKRDILDGFKSKSRFGLSLSTLGDMNLDGYGDFAVGAPYDGPNERGAVYIFQGSASGVIKQYSQVIYAEDVQSSFGGYNSLSTFGFSIAGGLDLDGNDYPDVAVGAYLSDTAYFFRARPVVRVEALVRFDQPKVVRLDRKTCDKPGDPRIKVPCTWIQVCMKYTGLGAPPRIDLNLQYLLDVQKSSYSRIYSSRGSGKEVNGTITLYKDTPFNCDRSLRDTIYLKESIADKLTDLEIQVKYSLRDSGYNYQQYQRNPTAILLPIIDLSTPAVVNDTISIFKNCGSDNVCIPDLHLFVRKEVTKYLYDADKPIEFDIEITNTKDDSYNTKFYVVLPQDIEFQGAPLIDNTQSESKLACSPTINASIFSCDIGNPLLKNTGVHFKLRVAPKRDQALLKPTYVFHMNVTSANPEVNTMSDNSVTISIDIWVDAILAIEGKSTPTTVYYNLSQYNEGTKAKWDTQLGPPVTHSYTVTNKGPSDVNEVEIYVIWPGSTLAGEDLLYLLEPPHTLDGVKCEKIDTNIGELALALQRDIWEVVGIHKNENGSYSGGNNTGTETERPIPGVTSNTITWTITALTFYDINKKPIHTMEVIGEPGSEEYWKNVSIAASQFTEPLTVEGNSSSLVIKYYNGREISRTIVDRKPGPAEMPYLSYQINSNVTTIVSYYAPTGNLVYQEYIIEQPGSKALKDRIQSTKDRLRQPLKILTNTTWHFDYVTSDNRIRYHYILSQTGTEFGTGAEISSTVIRTIITFYDSNGKILLQETVEGEPNTAAYWERVNKIISGFHETVTIRTNTTKVITYILNGKEIRKEEILVKPSPLQIPLTSNTKTVTTIKVTSSNGKVLFEENIPGEKGSNVYNEYFNGILGRIKEPVIIETKTVYTISYSSSDGRELYRGTYTEIRTETYNPNRIESSRTTTITTIIFYDSYGKIVHQENITEPVGSSAYWEKINGLMSRFQQQQITVNINTKTIITYYINGQEVRSEQVEGAVGTQEITYKPQTVITTTVTVYNSNGQVLDEQTMSGKIESVSHIISRYHEPITVEIKTVYTITYHAADGRVVYRGTFTETRTETHTPHQMQTSQISTITTIIFYDVNRNIVHQENITDAVGSGAYWERINGIISRYQQNQVTVHITTRRIITYYLNGQEIRSEQVAGPSGTQEISYRPQTVITTRVIVYGSNGRVLHDETTPGRKESINDIISKFNELITVEIQTIYTITYHSSDGHVIHTGIFIDKRTESHTPTSPQTTRKTTITTVIFYDVNRNIIYQEDVMEEPQSAAYWEKINKLITRFQQQYKQITIHITTRTIITYYVDGQATHTEEVTEGTGSHETSFRPRVVTTTTITVYNSNRKVLFEGTVTGEKGSTEYNNYISNILSKFREPITIVTKTTYTISYYGSGGRVVYTGTEFKEDTEVHNQQQKPDSQSTTVTTIIFYGPNGNIVHQETISDEPKSVLYWEHIKKAISDFDSPINIYTNSSKVITYYANGLQTRTEYVPGTTVAPFTSHIDDVVTVITYEDANKKVLYRETVNGELTREEKERRANEFSKRYRGDFKLEIDTTKTITFRTSDGQVLYTDVGIRPVRPEEASHTRIVTETTLTVYGPDGRSVVHKETINGEPGSSAYNNAVANIIGRFTGSITIYTNSTKTITSYTTDGRTLNQESVPEPRSTVQRQSDSRYANSATTTITFYGPDGQAIHHGTIDGAPGQDLYRQLDEIAKAYGGVVKSYGGQFNEDGSVGGPVTVVDGPYPGGKPITTGQHFTDFEAPHRQQHSQWNAGFNHSKRIEGEGYGYGSDSSSHRANFQDLNLNQQDLGAFAKGKGFRTGGIDLGINSGNVDQNIDGKARSNFESHNQRQSYDGSHNYLSGVQTYHHDGSVNREGQGKRKREVDTTDSDIEKLGQCATGKCFTIKCVSGPIRKGHEVHIALRARVVVQTLKNISMTQPVNIQSMLLARISRFQEISGSPAQRTLYRQQAVTSVMAPSPDLKPDIVPLWVVILSAVAGTLILLLLIFLLHKCGFFKRNRPSDAPERQPLNRNGHFQHGDEVL